jgi:iron(III) transport system permease protein
LAVPAPVIGISLISLLNRPGVAGWIYDSPLVIVAGYFVRFLPVAVLLLMPAVQRVPRELEQAARVDGCDWVAEHWHIRRPALLKDALVVWLIIVILCFAEVGATVLLAPPGWATASVRAFTLIHFGVYRDLAVLALLSVAFILLPCGLLLWFLRGSLRERPGVLRTPADSGRPTQ